jgi:hypothetical protein
MEFRSISLAVALLHLCNPVFSHPSAEPQGPLPVSVRPPPKTQGGPLKGYLPDTKPGDPIIEGSPCTRGITQCPEGTSCQSTMYQPSQTLLYCLHPDRTGVLHQPPLNNCRKLDDCGKGTYCRIYKGESSGRCDSLACRCGMGQNLCIPGTASCEYGNWGSRNGGCLTKVGIYANCL